MKIAIISSAVATVTMLALALPADARALNRSATTTGSNGGVYNRSANCATTGNGSGNCSWGRSGTTAGGKTFNRGGSASCANGVCSSQSGGTGIKGRSWNHQGSTTYGN